MTRDRATIIGENWVKRQQNILRAGRIARDKEDVIDRMIRARQGADAARSIGPTAY